jgi:hypothetical protein
MTDRDDRALSPMDRLLRNLTKVPTPMAQDPVPHEVEAEPKPMKKTAKGKRGAK